MSRAPCNHARLALQYNKYHSLNLTSIFAFCYSHKSQVLVKGISSLAPATAYRLLTALRHWAGDEYGFGGVGWGHGWFQALFGIQGYPTPNHRWHCVIHKALVCWPENTLATVCISNLGEPGITQWIILQNQLRSTLMIYGSGLQTARCESLMSREHITQITLL
jgi:hypothetical protein